jgi:putative aldouronate transport system substrate-binding protein
MILLVMILLVASLGILSGCTPSPSMTGTTTQAATTKVVPTTQPTSTEPFVNTMPITTDKITLKIYINFMTQAAVAMDSLSQHSVVKEIENITGLSFEFIHPTGDSKMFFSTLIASGELPDLYCTSSFSSDYPGGPEGAMKDGILLNINDLIMSYAPNYLAAIDDLGGEYASKGIYGDDGAIIRFGGQIYGSFLEGCTSAGLVIRKDLLEKTGLSAPVTIADWTGVLRKFKEMEIEIPLAMKTITSDTRNVIASAFGVGIREFQLVNDQVNYSMMLDGYKEYLALLKAWLDEGLIDREFINRSGSDSETMFYNGRAGAVWMGASSATTALKVGPTTNPDFDVLGCVYPRVNKDDHLTLVRRAHSLGSAAWFVSAKCKNPVEAVRLVDYLYAEEGYNLCVWGLGSKEIPTYAIDSVTGMRKFTDFMYTNYDFTTNRAIYTLQPFQVVYPDEMETQQYSLPQHAQLFEAFAWNRDDNERMPHLMTLTQDEANEFNPIMNVINTYADEMVYKFILGSASLNDFDSFRAKLKELGIERAAEIQQIAYERYLKR